MTSRASITAVLLLGLVTPAVASVNQTKQLAWISFAVFIVLFIAGAVYVRQRRTWRSQQGPRNTDGSSPAVAVDAWAKAAPPKENGKAGFGGGAGGGAWERDC